MRYLSLSLLLLLIIPFVTPAFGADWYDSNWLKARSIIIDGADIDTADLTNYPLYVNITSLDVGTVTQADCDDNVFTNYQNTTKFSHEIENCDGTANWIEAWVRVPTVYNANNTQFFMYYDNAGASDQQSTQATWNADYQLLIHLNGTFIDSTSSPITCTNSGTSVVPNEYVGDSRSWDGVDDYINCGSVAKIDNIFSGGGSISFWMMHSSAGEANDGRIIQKDGGVDDGFFIGNSDPSGGSMDIRFYNDGTTDGIWDTTSREIQQSVWNFVTIIYNKDATTNDLIIYVDGSAVAITEVSTP